MEARLAGLAGAGPDTLLARFDLPTPLTESRAFSARLRTTAVPNGGYLLTWTAYAYGGASMTTPAQVTIRNP